MMRPVVILLSIPGLRERDLSAMPELMRLVSGGDRAELVPSFPAVTCPVQAAMTTGRSPRDHGVVANGFYWRSSQEVEMWTAWNDCITQPQIWDRLHDLDPAIKSAVWFVMHSKGCGADYVCTPAPIHNPDGSESLWCYTKPEGLYQQLCDELGHFPLQHFWGPLAGVQSTAWIVTSAVRAAERYRPNFMYIYLPHLDFTAQKFGPDSDAAHRAASELDQELGKLVAGIERAFNDAPSWILAGEYAISEVDHVVYPNRLLREAGLLQVRPMDDGEHLDLAESLAWALVDHQLAHVFVRNADPPTVKRVADVFAGQAGIAEVLAGDQLARYGLDHERSGDVVLVSEPNSWQAYYWWLDDSQAPKFARKVDIHSKPGYDPVELFFDPATKEIPLDASLVKGSHGAPARHAFQRTIILCSKRGILNGAKNLSETDVASLVLRQFEDA